MDNRIFCQLSSYFKKQLLIDYQQNFLPVTFVKFMARFVFNFQTFKTDTSLKNCCKFTYMRLNVIDNITNETYKCTGFLETSRRRQGSVICSYLLHRYDVIQISNWIKGTEVVFFDRTAQKKKHVIGYLYIMYQFEAVILLKNGNATFFLRYF